MNKDLVQKKNDYLLELALEEQQDHDEDMQKYSEEVVEPHEFSPEHEARMRELFKKAEKVEKRAGRKRTRIQVAAGIAVVLCCSTLMVTQVDAFRVPVYNFFTEVKEKATRFGVEKETVNISDLSAEKRIYAPTYQPEGYKIKKIDESKKSFYITYINESTGDLYSFKFKENIDDSALDTENAIVEETQIEGNKALIIQKEKYVSILLYKDEHSFYITGLVPTEDALKIMESIK